MPFPAVPPPPPPVQPPADSRPAEGAPLKDALTESDLERIDPEDSACLTQGKLRAVAEQVKVEARRNIEASKKIASSGAASRQLKTRKLGS
jgi:hypothetical protein